MKKSETGEIEIHRPRDHIALVEICRPPHNFFDEALIAQLADSYETLDADSQVRAIVLAARGKAFCAGGRFSADGEVTTGPANVPGLYGQAGRLFAFSKPVIAAIQGAAVGGGFGLALSADFRIVAPEARFWANFVQLGFHPGFALSETLPRLIGHQKAALLLLTARRLDGAAAVEWGLAEGLAAADRLRETALDLAAEIAGQAPLAVAATRASLRAGLAAAAKKAMEIEWAAQARLAQTEDHKEGIRAISERRAGRFSGR